MFYCLTCFATVARAAVQRCGKDSQCCFVPEPLLQSGWGHVTEVWPARCGERDVCAFQTWQQSSLRHNRWALLTTLSSSQFSINKDSQSSQGTWVSLETYQESVLTALGCATWARNKGSCLVTEILHSFVKTYHSLVCPWHCSINGNIQIALK